MTSVPPSPRPAELADGGIADVLTVAAVVAAIVLLVTSTGSIVIPAGLVAWAVARRSSGVVFGAAVMAVSLRFATTNADDLAGLQSVLGAAGVIGPGVGAASAWLAGAAIVASATRLPVSRPDAALARVLPALGCGAFAAVVVAGPGPSDRLASRVAATAAFSLIAFLLVDSPLAGFRHRVAPVLGVLAVALAVVAAADRSTAIERLAVDPVGLVAIVLGILAVGVVATVRRSGAAGRVPAAALTFPAAAVVAGLVLAAQDVPGLGAAGLLLAAGGGVAAIADDRRAAVALGPGFAAVATTVGVTFASVDPWQAPGLLAAVVVAGVLVGTGGIAAPAGAALVPSGAVRVVAVVAAIGLAVGPTDGLVPADLADYQVGAAVALAVIAPIVVLRRRGRAAGQARPAPVNRPVTPGRLRRRSEPATPSHGSSIEYAEVEASVEVDRVDIDGEGPPPPQPAVAAPTRFVSAWTPRDERPGVGELRAGPGRAPE